MHNPALQLVRFGAMGLVQPFRGDAGTVFRRGAEVILRTARGLEWGTVLTTPAPLKQATTGTILRSLAPNDRLLIERIERNRQDAIEACEQRLREKSAGATLVDLELLFDGQTLVFYFVGEINGQIEEVTAELAELYEAKVQFRRFTNAVLEGCGPDCGVGDSGSCTDCTSCAVAAACGKSIGG